MASPVRLRGLLLLFVLFLLIAGALGLLWTQYRAAHVLPAFAPLAPFSLATRPRKEQYLFDYGERLGHYREGADKYLASLRQQHGIEAMIVTLADLPAGYSLDTLAVDLMNRWRIGGESGGRGLLLLLIDSRQQARLEVGYALEPLFTDAFSGYIEDRQLGAYYRANDLGTGLIAVMEEIEARAQLQPLGTDPAAVAGQMMPCSAAGRARSATWQPTKTRALWRSLAPRPQPAGQRRRMPPGSRCCVSGPASPGPGSPISTAP